MIALVLALAAGLDGLSAQQLELRGREHLYNLDYGEAREHFEALSARAPESPAGPYYEATTLWMEEFIRRGGMTGSTFRTSPYWSQQDPPPPELARDFKERVAETVARADAALSASPDDREALYFRGAVEGLLSGYLAVIEHSYMGAYRAGKRGKEFHERLLALEPSYADAALLPGIYEYTVASLPRSVRLAGWLLGIQGSREKGLELVRKASEGGDRTRWSSRLSLIVMQQRERKYRSALRTLRELQSAFPRNPLFLVEQGAVSMLRKDWMGAQRAFERVLVEQDRKTANFDAVERGRVLLRLGEAHLYDENYSTADGLFDAALSESTASDRTRAAVFVRRGMTSDVRGQRKAAIWDYRRALSIDVDPYTSKLARCFLDEPYR